MKPIKLEADAFTGKKRNCFQVFTCEAKLKVGLTAMNQAHDVSHTVKMLRSVFQFRDEVETGLFSHTEQIVNLLPVFFFFFSLKGTQLLKIVKNVSRVNTYNF